MCHWHMTCMRYPPLRIDRHRMPCSSSNQLPTMIPHCTANTLSHLPSSCTDPRHTRCTRHCRRESTAQQHTSCSHKTTVLSRCCTVQRGTLCTTANSRYCTSPVDTPHTLSWRWLQIDQQGTTSTTTGLPPARCHQRHRLCRQTRTAHCTVRCCSCCTTSSRCCPRTAQLDTPHTPLGLCSGRTFQRHMGHMTSRSGHCRYRRHTHCTTSSWLVQIDHLNKLCTIQDQCRCRIVLPDTPCTTTTR